MVLNNGHDATAKLIFDLVDKMSSLHCVSNVLKCSEESVDLKSATLVHLSFTTWKHKTHNASGQG